MKSRSLGTLVAEAGSTIMFATYMYIVYVMRTSRNAMSACNVMRILLHAVSKQSITLPNSFLAVFIWHQFAQSLICDLVSALYAAFFQIVYNTLQNPDVVLAGPEEVGSAAQNT